MSDGLFSDMFDLNDDGDMDLGEEIIETGFVMDILDSINDEDYNNFDGGDDYSWRDKYEYDANTMIDPEDYEDEDEYLEELDAEKHNWREFCDENEYGINPEDYDTEDEYNHAVDGAELSAFEENEDFDEEEDEEDISELSSDLCDETSKIVSIEAEIQAVYDRQEQIFTELQNLYTQLEVLE